MKQPKRLLNPGDVVYRVFGSVVHDRLIVTQVSDTVAYAALNERSDYTTILCRYYSPRPGVAIKQMLRPQWDTAQYFAESPELNAKYQHGELVHMVQVAAKSKADRLSTEQLKLILTILNDTENGK